jgi:hypothetical protein
MSVRGLAVVLLLGVIVVLSGCATVAHGRYQQVPISSNPSGASVDVDCGLGPVPAGQTPVVVKMPRKAQFCVVTLTHDGYKPSTITFGRRWSGWVWGNLLLGDWFLAGAAADLVDGAFYKRAPEKARVTMSVAEAAAN